MIRRTFFQTLAAALLPNPVIAMANDEPPGHEPPALALPSTAPIQDPEWLQEWRKIPKVEIYAKDLECHDDPQQCAMAEVIMRYIPGNIPLTFRYSGGTEPGAVRTVRPILLFYPDYCPHRMFYEDPTELPEFNQTPFYLLAWCQSRNAPRTFRLDRMQANFL